MALARRDGERIRAPREGAIAVEIAFLARYGMPPGPLLAATRAAHDGVTADQALLADGLMREEDFYRLLARHLGAPQFRAEMTIAPCDPAGAVASGIAPLAPNAEGLPHVLAPRGRALALLLAAAPKRSPPAFAISSPQRLGAAIRRQMGRRIANDAAGALERADPALAARTDFSNGQLACVVLLAFAAPLAAWRQPEALSALCAVVLYAVFAASVALRFAALTARAPARADPPLDDRDLPVYSIIAPLYREAKVAGRLIDALEAIDYPKARLDIKIVVERDDLETLTALARMRLPARYDVIVAPPGAPATKPRALNVALPFARGDLVVIYDAEDTPAPDQLRRAAARFRADPDVDCLQARLVVDNIDDSWLTRMFAMEYAALFDIINPGLAALDAPIALGGTSNHFRAEVLRRVGGWDAWNVTEDADLGLRLARFGRRVGALDSDTYEEAPADFRNWFGQRRRWLKGWMQTLAVHTRAPRRLFRELGATRALAALALMLGAALGGLLGPALAACALWRVLAGQLLAAPTAWQGVGDALALALLLSGFQAIVIPILLALRGRGLQRLHRSLPLLPLYYGLVSIAAWAALIDLAWRPYHWSKTEHGLARSSARASGEVRDRLIS